MTICFLFLYSFLFLYLWDIEVRRMELDKSETHWPVATIDFGRKCNVSGVGVPGELMILPERRVPYLFRAQELVRCRAVETLDDEPDAQRKLKYEDRKCGQRSQGGILPDDTE